MKREDAFPYLSPRAPGQPIDFSGVVPVYRWPESIAPLGTPAKGALATLPQTARDKVEILAGEIHGITRIVTGRPIADAAEAQLVATGLVRAKTALGDIEEARQALTAPLIERLSAIRSIYAPLEAALKAFLDRAKTVQLGWIQQERARVAREEEAGRKILEEAAQREATAVIKAQTAKTEKARQKALAEAEAASKQQTEALIAMPAEAPHLLKPQDGGSVGTTERYVLQGIVNLELIPKAYWRDPVVIAALEKVLRAAVKAGYHEIPGCAIGIEEGIAVRLG